MEIIRQDIGKNGIKTIVLDSLRGYNMAMKEFGNLVANMQNLINYTRFVRVTIFLVSKQEKITGDLQITTSGESFIADSILLLRYAEYHGQVIRVVSCLKKRFGDSEPDIRELTISDQGIRVGSKKLDSLQGLLTGVPTSAQSDH